MEEQSNVVSEGVPEPNVGKRGKAAGTSKVGALFAQKCYRSSFVGGVDSGITVLHFLEVV